MLIPAQIVGLTVNDLVDQVRLDNYTHFLNDLLYTHLENNRGFKWYNSAYYPSPDHNAARDAVYNFFSGLGLQTQMDNFTFWDPSDAVMYCDCANVVGVLPGRLRPTEIYIVGGHYDSMHNPGADDDGSGLAAVMEIARVLSPHPFEATLVFIAFDAEEIAFQGSGHYVTQHASDNIQAMLSMDMIAFNPDNVTQVSLFAHPPSSPLCQKVSAAVSQYAGGLTAVWDTDRNQNVSDHAPFEQAGFQACCLSEYDYRLNPYWHWAGDAVDTPNFIHYPMAVSLTRAAVGLLAACAVPLAPPDLSAVLSAMDSRLGQVDYDLRADLDNDGEVTSTDLSIVLNP